MKSYPRKYLSAFVLLSAMASPIAALAIDAPTDIDATQTAAQTVLWDWESVSGAAKYEVTVDGRYAGTIAASRYKGERLWVGEHSLTVRAVSGSGERSEQSRTSKIFVRANVPPSGDDNPPQNPGPSGFGAPVANEPQVNKDTIVWSWSVVDGAKEYAVTVDGKFVGNTRTQKWTSLGLWVGDHSMTVEAVKSDGTRSTQSKTAKAVVLQDGPPGVPDDVPPTEPTRFGAPVVNEARVSGSTIEWSWRAVSGASKYEVTVDGEYAGETGSLQWTSNGLWVGEHSMTVKARTSAGIRSQSSRTAKAEITEDTPNPDDGNNPDAVESKLIDPRSYDYAEVREKAGYELVFSDEFNGSTLNTDRWDSSFQWDSDWNGERYEYRIINQERQFYVSPYGDDQENIDRFASVFNPFEFDGERLTIRAAVNPLKKDYARGRKDNGPLVYVAQQQPFLSGVISSNTKFYTKYGYFEARIKIPDYTGTFPAFWLIAENRRNEEERGLATEIDIMENLGHKPDYIYNAFHYYENYYDSKATAISPLSDRGQIKTGVNQGKKYTVYAVEWERDKVTWFIDGVEVNQLIDPAVNYEELHVNLNLAMGGKWMENASESIGGLGRPFPSAYELSNFGNPAMEIDYVRVYKKR